MLQKDIRKKLLEEKEKKENILIETEIVKNSLLLVFENEKNIRNFHLLPKRKKLQLSLEMLYEFKYLKENNLISEQLDFFGVLKNLFGSFLGKSAVETIAEPIVGKILSAVGFKSEGIMKKTMISFLTTNPSTLIEAFGDCNKMSKLLLESFSEGLVMKLQDEIDRDSFMYDYIRNTLGGTLKETSAVSGLENMIADKICDMFSGFASNAREVLQKLTGS